MSVRQRIELAIADEPKDRANRQAAKIKAEAIAERLADEAERVFSLAGGRKAIISESLSPFDGDGDPLRFHLRIVNGKGKVLYADDQLIFNPPIMVQVGVENDGVTPVLQEDTRGALRAIVANIAREVLDKGKG